MSGGMGEWGHGWVVGGCMCVHARNWMRSSTLDDLPALIVHNI